ncbi:hypothetical protein DFP72DRAFT_467723 [Ephemerocybe angulata]|uniref:Uncharacterized protein n=1 Tax=Ephemerocybe angulata TaxID=980116 RepID=A0A8H6HRK9_9AGAR|nr:hypothetical protein DFP72DRAFT_467723 [Tulosesus angulatus]
MHVLLLRLYFASHRRCRNRLVLQLSPSSSQPPTTSCTSPLPSPPLAMKKSALKSTKCSLLAARKASLQRKRRIGIDLGEAGLGPERIRGESQSMVLSLLPAGGKGKLHSTDAHAGVTALVAESVENLRRTHKARRQSQGTFPNVVLTVSFATGAPRPSRGLGAASMAANIFQNAENFVLGDVDIITAGGNVERHEHIHVHIHIVRAPTARRRARGSGDSDTFPEGGGLRHLYSTRRGDARVDAMIAPLVFFFFFDPSRIAPI